ncbi:pollen-specific leucine-rich repeat extensin-like protein 3 [Iris pallida]|uniref:Pollen-specific leucine-rich repeat extensin-like protein 3 n=1 Tax=Iris pallida TaxID=29817 RepID=A0AAX6DRT3_IRIPA|nr:pollen-specific leucine-rich repeat extensin-like protein 3 [Iris pallida]KAJ6819570.1 pollen-specific leucine-rich repeat extensin-like protein 3 [Iris pallida]
MSRRQGNRASTDQPIGAERSGTAAVLEARRRRRQFHARPGGNSVTHRRGGRGDNGQSVGCGCVQVHSLSLYSLCYSWFWWRG